MRVCARNQRLHGPASAWFDLRRSGLGQVARPLFIGIPSHRHAHASLDVALWFAKQADVNLRMVHRLRNAIKDDVFGINAAVDDGNLYLLSIAVQIRFGTGWPG